MKLEREEKMATDISDMKRTYRTAVAGEFPDELSIGLVKESDLKYGENPNQPAAVYRFKGSSLAEFTNIRLAKTGKGGISATNFMDVCRGLDILKYFDNPAVAVMKHTIPSGFATASPSIVYDGMAPLYIQARDADARSAFGSIVIFNRIVNRSTAQAITETYVEGVAAPEYDPSAMEILEQKKDLRVMLFSNLDKLPRFVGDDTQGLYDMKVLPTGRAIVQKPYLTSIRNANDLVLDALVRDKEGKEHIMERVPTKIELEDMLTAWYINFGVRSNGIVIVHGGVTLAVGSGQQERVGAVEQAIVKAYQKSYDREGRKFDPLKGVGRIGKEGYEPNDNDLEVLNGAVVSSDAFFPNRDSIDTMARVGVSAVIQPGGSIKDSEIIDAVNQHGMSMAFTLERCFGHF